MTTFGIDGKPRPSSFASETVFSDVEREQIERYLDGHKYDVKGKAIRFRNSLQAFLRDTERGQAATPPTIVFAVDSTEVYALVRRDKATLVGFSFDGLLPNSEPHFQRRLEVVDSLISDRLFNSSDRWLLLPDPYASEVNDLERTLIQIGDQASKSLPVETTDLPVSAFERMRDWLISKRSHPEFASEWTKFRDEMIPSWGDELISNLVAAPAEIAALYSFKRDGRYSFLRPDSFGTRAFSKLLPEAIRADFDFEKFEEFSNTDQAVNRAKEVYDVTLDVLIGIGRANRQADRLLASSVRDAQVFATIDMINYYFDVINLNAKVELVTRSAAMHGVLAAMPPGRLRVTLRHPLFLADIYRFDRETIHAIGEHLQTIDGLLEPAAELRENDTRDERLRDSAQQIFRLLESMIVAQHTIERRVDFRSSAPDFNRNLQLIEAVFNTLVAGVRDRSDPFARELNVRAIDRVLAISKSAVEEMGNAAATKVRAIRIGGVDKNSSVRKCPEIVPGDFLAVRLVGGSYSRLIHLHSKRAQSVFWRENDERKTHPLTPFDPFEIVVDRRKLVDNIADSLDQLKKSPLLDSRPTVENDHFRFIVDSTLMLGMVFAGERRFALASMLASVVLHPMVMVIRAGIGEGQSSDYLGRYLAFRELFLFRHYCERASAISDYFGDSHGFGGTKGFVSKSLARAQRDIDFAALMGEEAERCSGLVVVNSAAQPVSSAGHSTIRDGRLRLAHFGSVVDQLLLVLEDDRTARLGLPRSFRSEMPTLRTRMDTWVMAGLIKELCGDAYEALRARQELQAGGQNGCNAEVRYFAHIEARALQSVLQAFVIFMTYEISPPLHRMWTAEPSLDAERLLVFRDWESWWIRYRKLKMDFNFTMRSFALIETVCESLSKIAAVAREPSVSLGFDRSAFKLEVLRSIQIEIVSCTERVRSLQVQARDRSGFVSRISTRLIERLDDIKAKEIDPKINRPV